MDKAPVYSTAITDASIRAAMTVSTRKSSLRLYISQACLEYQWKRIAIIANLVGVALETIKVSDEELATLMPQARECVLATKEGFLSQTTTISRYLAAIRPDVGLGGVSENDEAFVDQWVEFCWYELEVILAATSKHGVGSADEDALQRFAREDCLKALQVLDSHLLNRTFLAGSHLSIADVHNAVVCHELLSGLVDEPTFMQFTSLVRWYLTCVHHPIVKAVLGEMKLSTAPRPAKVPLNSSKETPSPTVQELVKPAIKPPKMRFSRKRIRVVDLFRDGSKHLNTSVTVQGWARTIREADKGRLLFIQLSDGSCPGDIQIVVTVEVPGFEDAKPSACGGTDASFSVVGKVVASQGSGQAFEIQASKVEVLGKVFAGENGEVGGKFYPMARNRKGHTLEYLRSQAHLRPRARSYAAVQRVRNAMAFATHQFFYDRGFLYIHTPLITGADCEGAGEMFNVTTLLPKDPKDPIPRTKEGLVDYSMDFFGQQAGLTVSGQLNVETHCCALSDVYTFGPTFRAENSHTSRHLAEFWMIEPEIAFAQLEDDMDLAEDYLKFCVHYALTRCAEDLEALEKVPGWDPELRSRLMNVLERPFTRLTYTEAIQILEKEVLEKKVTFEEPVSWGIDMASEHERYLAEKLFKGPIIVTNYPKDIKAFYMKLDGDGKTVQAMDILVPRIGEIIGGSVREDRFEVLKQRAAEMHVPEEEISWYLDLRKYGSVPHAGFGLGFERLVMLVTGVENIRDVIPFPRYPGHCEF